MQTRKFLGRMQVVPDDDQKAYCYSAVLKWHHRHDGILRFNAEYGNIGRADSTNSAGRTNYCTTLRSE